MALSDAGLDAAWTKARSKNGPQWVPYFEALRAVAALVRKDDEALIQQLVEALEWTVAPPCMCWAGCEACHPANPPNPVAAITAGRARLEGKP